MGVWADERAQSIQIGAILLFGVLILAFVGYQATVVPNQNAGVEAGHSQDVQADMVDVRNTILGTAATGDARPASVDLGPTYPARAMFVNPGPPAGTLETVELGGSNRIQVSNAAAVDPETADYWDGTTTHTYDTRGIQYVPQYKVYSNVPSSVYENSVLYNRFDRGFVSIDAATLGGSVALNKTGQTVVNGRTITLVALHGDRDDASTETVSVDPKVVSAPMRTITVERESAGAPVTVTVPTQLTAATWERLLQPEMASNGGYITDVSVSSGELTLEFKEMDGGNAVSYELRLAGVAIGESTASSSASYITAIDGDDTSVVEGSTQKLVVEVRDEYNNPVSGVAVDASTDSTFTNDGVTPTSATTDENGRAEFIYEAPPNTNGKKDVDITTTFDGGGSAEKEVVFDVRVVSISGGGGGGGGSDKPPKATITAVRDNSMCTNTNPSGNCRGNAFLNFASFSVDWSATDDNGISSVQVRLLDSGGNVVDTENPPASGTSAAGTVTVSDQNGYGDDYTIRLIATDTATPQQQNTDEVSDTADGTDP